MDGCGCGWDLDEQRGAAAGWASDFEHSAERLDAVADPDQSRPPGGVCPADPVVADRHPHHLVVRIEFDVYDGGVRVLGRIGQRL